MKRRLVLVFVLCCAFLSSPALAQNKSFSLDEAQVNEIAKEKLVELATLYIQKSIAANLREQYAPLYTIFQPLMEDVANRDVQAIPNDMLRALWTLAFVMIVLDETLNDEASATALAAAVQSMWAAGHDEDDFTKDQAKFFFAYAVATELRNQTSDERRKRDPTAAAVDQLLRLGAVIADSEAQNYFLNNAKSSAAATAERLKPSDALAGERKISRASAFLDSLALFVGKAAASCLQPTDQAGQPKAALSEPALAACLDRVDFGASLAEGLSLFFESMLSIEGRVLFDADSNESTRLHSGTTQSDVRRTAKADLKMKQDGAVLPEQLAAQELRIIRDMLRSDPMVFRSPSRIWSVNFSRVNHYKDDEIHRLVVGIVAGLKKGLIIATNEDGKRRVSLDRAVVVSALAEQWADVNRQGLGPILTVGTGANGYYYMGKILYRTREAPDETAGADQDAANPTLPNRGGVDPFVYEKIGARYLWPYRWSFLHDILTGQSLGGWGSGILANVIREHHESYELDFGASYGIHFVNSIILSFSPGVMFLTPDTFETGHGQVTLPVYWSMTVGLEFGLWEYLSDKK